MFLRDEELDVLQRTAKKCTKIYNARAELLAWFSHFLKPFVW